MEAYLFVELTGRKTIQMRDFTTTIESDDKYDFLEGCLFGKTGCTGLSKNG